MQIPNLQKLFAYIPAKPHLNKSGAYIDYYTPGQDGGRVRHMIRCNRQVNALPNRNAKLRYLQQLCAVINSQLFVNLSPTACDTTCHNSNRHITLKQACRIFLDEKQKYLRPDTMRTYRSLVKRISDFKPFDNLSADSVTKQHALQLLDSLTGLSNRAYNNYLKQSRSLFAFLVERDICPVNPFSDIKPRRNDPKKRTLISPADRQRILDYCDSNLPSLSLVVLLVYSALIRPKEIRLLTVGDVDLERHQITVRATVAKNRHERMSTFTPQIEQRLLSMQLDRLPKSRYLIGLSDKPVADKRFLKDWYKVKRALSLPDTYQLYSLRDTGITDMIKAGIDDLTVMQHADHSDLSITSIYARHNDNRLSNIIYSRAPRF